MGIKHSCLEKDVLVPCRDLGDWTKPYCTYGDFHAGFTEWLKVVPENLKPKMSEAVSVVLRTSFDFGSLNPVNDLYIKSCLKRLNIYVKKFLEEKDEAPQFDILSETYNISGKIKNENIDDCPFDLRS